MIEITLTIINKLGLHARASAKLVSIASKFHSSITIIKEKQSINGKSIMAVMMLAAPKGTTLSFQIDGPDEQEMTQAICNLINNKFGETE